MTCGDTQINAKDLKPVIMKLKVRDQVTGKTQFEAQFEVCSELYIWATPILYFKFQVLNQVTSDPDRNNNAAGKNKTSIDFFPSETAIKHGEDLFGNMHASYVDVRHIILCLIV